MTNARYHAALALLVAATLMVLTQTVYYVPEFGAVGLDVFGYVSVEYLPGYGFQYQAG